MKIEVWNEERAYYETIETNSPNVDDTIQQLSKQLGFDLQYSFDINTVVLDFVD